MVRSGRREEEREKGREWRDTNNIVAGRRLLDSPYTSTLIGTVQE